MASAVAAFDRDEAIRILEVHGLGPVAASGIVDVLESQVLPQVASKRGEASARGRLTSRINTAFDQISEIVVRVAGIEDQLVRVEDRLTRVEETMATKQDLAQGLSDLRNDMLVKFGMMLAGAVGFLTLVQGFMN